MSRVHMGVAAFGAAALLVLAPAGVLMRHEATPRVELRAVLKLLEIANGGGTLIDVVCPVRGRAVQFQARRS